MPAVAADHIRPLHVGHDEHGLDHGYAHHVASAPASDFARRESRALSISAISVFIVRSADRDTGRRIAFAEI